MLTINKYIFCGAYQIRLIMLLRKYFIGILILGCSMQAMAQTTTSQQDTHHFAFYGGFGPNLYFNNLAIGKNYVNTFNYSFTGRFMWEPGHVLSIGVESGYYRMYTLTTPQPNQVHIANSAIPLQIVLSMKFWEN